MAIIRFIRRGGSSKKGDRLKIQAVLGSIRFKRTLKKFLECEDLESEKGVALVEKLRQASKDSLDLLIQAIPETTGLHQACCAKSAAKIVEGATEELFLNHLDDDQNQYPHHGGVDSVRSRRRSARANCSRSCTNPMFPNPKIIDILAFQREELKPEQIITNALKLDKAHAEQLLKLAQDSKQPLDLELLRVDPAAIGSRRSRSCCCAISPPSKSPRLRQIIAKFLKDENKTVVIEALKSLKG